MRRSWFVASILLLSLTASPLTATADPSSPLASRCPPAWSFVPFASAPGTPSPASVMVVSGTGPSDVWGVGQAATGSALVLHFDGTEWNAPQQPNPAGLLNSVVAVSPSDAWAVGRKNTHSGARALVEHWNGATWASVADAAAGFRESNLTRVVADAPDDVWTLGVVTEPGGSTRPFVERWDGSGWTEVGPLALPDQAAINDIDILSPGDAWAVGKQNTGPLAEHWDGTAWTVVPTPKVGLFPGHLSALAAVSTNDVWATGESGRHLVPPLIEHWNGLAWSVIEADRDPRKTDLTTVVATSADDIWTAGRSRRNPYVEHWDGIGWRNVSQIPVRGRRFRPPFAPLGSAGPGEIWSGSGARICPIVLTDTGMSPRYADTTSPIPLRSGSVTRVVPRTVAWRVDPLAAHTSSVRETSLGLFDSGPLLPGASFTYDFGSAGTYTVQHLPSGKFGSVGIPLRVRPPHGSIDQVFHVWWGSGLADVEVKPPGSTRFLFWQRRTYAESADFTNLDPLWAGPGTYSFRARLHGDDPRRVTDWSPASSIRIR